MIHFSNHFWERHSGISESPGLVATLPVPILRGPCRSFVCCSRADRFTAAATEFRAARIATAAGYANHFYRPWLTPIKRRRRANENAALSAESDAGRVLLFATRARHCSRRCSGWTNADLLNARPFVGYRYES